MGSTPSTPNRDSSDDPWWTIENQILELNPNEMEEASANDSTSAPIQQNPVAQAVHSAESISDSNLNINNNDNENSNNENSDFNENNTEGIDTVNTSSSNEHCENDNIECIDPDVSVKMENSKREPLSKRQQSLEEFKEELRIKRELRTNAITVLRNEITSLREQLAHEKAHNQQLIEQQNKESLCQICSSIYKSIEPIDGQEMALAGATATNADNQRASNVSLRSHLAEIQCALQNANAEILTLTSELTATKQQAKSLKEVIAASKEIIEIRETELSQLKSKLKDIENSLAEREMQMMSENLRQEYDRQLANIRNLRALYEERARISAAEKENLNRQLETSRAELSSEVEKNKNLEDHIASLDADLKSTTIDLYATKEQLAYYKAENKDLHDEMTVVNQLFGQLLAGFNGNNNIDIDKLTLMLEENRDLLNDITNKENCKQGAAQIPKLIFDLVSQANKQPENDETAAGASEPIASTSQESDAKVTSAQEIIHNLPKVWRVLIELLNHQELKPVQLKAANQHDLCYKSVQTPTGPQMVLSVSKTYIRLKDLIMEKKFLQKETKKMKNLNSHLESRLEEQEQRLSAVTIELNKTWNLVGRMQRQHRQLHTHEQVLRYQLQQKRRMLSELKEELEYCRRKWALAKEKNNESQSQWESLRLEFSQRKESDLNNSGESGYSDSPVSEEDDDDDDDEESSISLQIVRDSRQKKKINLEKFLLTPEQIDRKMMRIHSVSPVRCARISISRRNSDSHITQFATEVCQAASDVVEPLAQVCAECGENCVKHLVHFDADAGSCEATEQVKVSEPIVHGAKSKLTNAQKIVEAKASTSKTKMCCELRRNVAVTKKPIVASKQEESLEEMFLRLSGSENAETSNENSEIGDDSLDDRETSVETVASSSLEQDEQIVRIEQLEAQCKQLINRVMRASHRSDDLNKIVDEVRSKFGRNSTPAQDPSQPSTSVKTDEQCLSATEQEFRARRDKRLKRIEAESQAYLNRVKSMNHRAASVDTKLHDVLRRRQADESVNESVNTVNESTSLQPSTSTKHEAKSTSISKTDDQCLTAAEREYLARRDERLKRLEAESLAHLKRMKSSVYGNVSDASDVNFNNQAHSSTSEPETSNTTSKTDEQCLTSAERDYVSRRDERLKRLEAETQAYMNRVKSTNRRATDVDTKLEYLHGRYGNETDCVGESSSRPGQSTSSNRSSSEPEVECTEELPNRECPNETDHSTDDVPPNNDTENTSD